MTNNLATAILHALARVEDISPTQLDYMLYYYIDTEALQGLEGHENATWELTFEVPNHEVTVTSDGDIIIDERYFEKDQV